jgi:hypothetical protein
VHFRSGATRSRVELGFDGLLEQRDHDDLRSVVQDGVRPERAGELEGKKPGSALSRSRRARVPNASRATGQKEAALNGRAGGERQRGFGTALLDSEFGHVRANIGPGPGERYIFSSLAAGVTYGLHAD